MDENRGIFGEGDDWQTALKITRWAIIGFFVLACLTPYWKFLRPHNAIISTVCGVMFGVMLLFYMALLFLRASSQGRQRRREIERQAALQTQLLWNDDDA